jgi:hypothetical protein
MSNNELMQNFDEGGDTENRVIQGTFLKFTTDAIWRTGDGVAIEPGRRLIALGCATILQCWRGGMPVDTIVKEAGKDLPDIDTLNNKIPPDQWEVGLTGERRPPWQVQRVVYLLDPETAERLTFASGAIGARVAVSDLKDRVSTMQMLRGANVRPVIELSSKPMKTRFGVRQRPEFVITEWIEFSDDGVPRLAAPKSPDLVPEPTTAEIVGDSIAY